MTTKFERLGQLEASIRVRNLTQSFAKAGDSMHARGASADALVKEKAELNSIMDGMSLDEMRAYGEWRKGR